MYSRERRLRSCAKHERLSVAMALAKALHHTPGPSMKKVVERREGSEEVEDEKHSGPRAPKTPSPETRPAHLKHHVHLWQALLFRALIALLHVLWRFLLLLSPTRHLALTSSSAQLPDNLHCAPTLHLL